MRTFVHHSGALGDVLLSLGCFHALKRNGAQLHLAAGPAVGSLLQDAGIADEISDAGSARYAALHGPDPGRHAAALFSSFERAVVFTADSSNRIPDVVRRIIPDTHIVTTIPPPGAGIAVHDHRLAQIAPGCVPQQVLLAPSPRSQETADRCLVDAGPNAGRPFVAIHPGSGGRHKCWPLDRFFQLADIVSRRDGLQVLFLTGPAEDPSLRECIDDFARGSSGVSVVHDAELEIVAALLSRATLFIGNDSGVSHLAAAVGCPAVALFGPTDPAVWRPFGRAVETIAAASLQDITVERVYRSVADRVRAGVGTR